MIYVSNFSKDAKNAQLLSLFAALFFACTQTPIPQTEAVKQAETKTDLQTPSPTEVRQSPTSPITLPEIKKFAVVSIWRQSDRQDQYGISLPPYREVRTENIGLDKEPAMGEKVTVIPLEVNFAPFELKIIKANKAQAGCDDKDLEMYWATELEAIERKEFFEVEPLSNRNREFPFDVCILYPSVEFAQPLRKNQLSKGMLPKGVSISTVRAAIDLTNDLQPDLLIVSHCCDDATKSADDPAHDCYHCGKSFKKLKDGWKLVDTSAPC